MDDYPSHAANLDLLDAPPAADDELVRRFVANRDERAFGELVVRHSDLVWSVCRRTLRNQHDAEEAFQATFLVLAGKAARVRTERTLGPWLYGVAYRVSIRAAAKRQRRREARLPDDAAMTDDVLENVSECHWRRVLDDELNELPEKYRSVLVLHYLLGKTNKEVAAELDLSTRTVEGRQRRGKALLKRRLTLRKVSLPAALASVAAAEASHCAAAAPLVEGAIRAGLSFIHGNSQACSATAVRLAQSEAIAMTTTLAPISATFVTLIALGAAMTVAGGDSPAQGDGGLNLTVAAADATAPADVAVISDAAAAEVFDIAQQAPETSAAEGEGPRVSDLFVRSEAEEKIQSSLDAALQSPLDYAAMPLSQVTHQISDDYGIPIVFDTRALDTVAISPETEVTVQISNISLRSALNLMLDQLENITYIIKDDVLIITTEEVAGSHLEPHIYDVRYLSDVFSAADIAAAIPEMVHGETWMSAGSGEGTIKQLGDGLIAISQSQEVHHAIGKLLKQMERHAKKVNDGL